MDEGDGVTRTPSLSIALLGNLEVRVGDETVDLRGPQPRLVLAMLAVARGGSKQTIDIERD